MIARPLFAAGFALVAALCAPSLAAAAEAVKIAFHVDDNDPAKMNLTLNNAANVAKYYEAQGTPTEIEVVTYGPGLMMLVAGKSPVAARIAAMSLEHESLSFSACANTMAGMEKKTGAPVVLISEAKITPSGVVRLVELQGQGYAYIKP
jgi:intracellular sulfur oxidation DsrE/DsrF family protein